MKYELSYILEVPDNPPSKSRGYIRSQEDAEELAHEIATEASLEHIMQDGSESLTVNEVKEIVDETTTTNNI